MAKYVMALDAGTTSNRCILFNERENCAALHRGNSHSIFQNQDGLNMMLMRFGQVCLV